MSSPKRCAQRFSEEECHLIFERVSNFIVAMGIDYVSMARRCYGHNSDDQC
jgi:hypothetical protein